MKRNSKTLWIFAIIAIIICIHSCGPSKEQIETKKAEAKNKRYKVGNVVYLKPDSCDALITGYDVSFNYNGVTNYDSAIVLYTIRDCRGNETTTKDEFIYGLKHR